MKYIRTKDGIMNISQTNTPYVIINGEYRMISTFKQADTIEELCDEFVCIDKATKCHTLWKVIDKNDLFLEDYEWFCAIWTDRGLIYVAKMNDKGELELL